MRYSSFGNGIIFRIKDTDLENSTKKYSESSKNSFTPYPLFSRYRIKSTPLDTIQEEKFIVPSLNLPENNNDFSGYRLRNMPPISLGEPAMIDHKSVRVLSNYVQNIQSISNPQNELLNSQSISNPQNELSDTIPVQPNDESEERNINPSISPNSAHISQNCNCQIS
jgi:hypothetical protein